MITEYFSFSPRNPWPAVFIGVLALVIALAAHVAGLLKIPNGVLYDLAMRYSPAAPIRSDRVLVVTGNPGDLKAQATPWLKTLQILEQLGARQVVFTFVPENPSPQFFSAAEVRGKVVFGRRTESSGNGERIMPWPPDAESLEIPFGLVRIPSSVYGVHRAQARTHIGEFGTYPDLAFIAAQRFLEGTGGLPDADYFVNFLGGLDRLPQVSLKRLLAGGLIPELVHNRSVVVGLNQEVGLHTPITSGDTMMSLPVYQAYALDTLIEGRWIRTTPLWVTALMLGWVTLISVVAYQWTGVRLASWLTGLLIAIYVASAWLLLSYAWVWPPLMELLIVQAVCFLLITRHRTLANEQSFRQILLETSTRLKERVITRDFYEVDDPWPQLIRFVQNILDLDRSIFMERVPNKTFVRVGAGYQCTEDDIHEQRRDYRREPYSTAIAENRPIPLTRAYLEVREHEDQYLVPLGYGNEILGFWAFGIETAKAHAMPRFLAVADQFSAEIGRLLFQRSRWQASRQSESAVLTNYLRLQGGAIAGGPFSETVHQLVRRMEALEWIINGVETPIAAYDIFGQIMHINEAMSTLLGEHEVRFYDMGALDLLAALSAKDPDYSRSVFQHVALGGEPISLIASLGGEDERFLLHIAPLARARGGDEGSGDSVERQGMIFQLTDISPLQAPIEMREESLQRVISRLRNDMESMMLAKSLLDDEKQPKTALAQAINILKA
ncbi:MAG: CHASE2 domain-containing protein, partial [Gammaproteobacteria bacterium]|nr:CHASE2 domain-containing protein [Gammaproteobacteria bacterium]